MFDWLSPKILTTIAAWLICLGVVWSAVHRLDLSDENTSAGRNRADAKSLSAMLHEFVRAVVGIFEIMFILVVLYLAASASKNVFAYAALAIGQATFILHLIALIMPISMSIEAPDEFPFARHIPALACALLLSLLAFGFARMISQLIFAQAAGA